MTRKQQMALLRWSAVIFVCMLLMPWAAQLTKADDITLTYGKPTEAEQSTTVPLVSPISGYRFWQLVAEVDDSDTLMVVLPGKLPGTYQYKATSYDELGAESTMSNMAVKVVTEFVVGTDTRVYSILKSNGRFLFIAMGNVPTGTACDVDFFAQGDMPNNEGLATAYGVPFDLVTWTGSATTQMPIAKCQ